MQLDRFVQRSMFGQNIRRFKFCFIFSFIQRSHYRMETSIFFE